MAGHVQVLSDSDESEEFEGFVVSPEERAKYEELVRKRSVEEAFGSDDETEISEGDDSDDEEEGESDSDEEDGAHNGNVANNFMK